MIDDLNHALSVAEIDKNISVIVLTGSSKAFAAGADIKEMSSKSFSDLIDNDFIKPWEKISLCKKPTIAAVDGYALGGGCELAMMCDFIICSDTAKFGQPEINLGVSAGLGGTQRLTRFIGKSKSIRQSKVRFTDPSVEFSMGTIPKSHNPCFTSSNTDLIVDSGFVSTEEPNLFCNAD